MPLSPDLPPRDKSVFIGSYHQILLDHRILIQKWHCPYRFCLCIHLHLRRHICRQFFSLCRMFCCIRGQAWIVNPIASIWHKQMFKNTTMILQYFRILKYHWHILKLVIILCMRHKLMIYNILFSVYNIFILSNIVYGFLVYNETCIFLCCKKTNGFQYSLVNTHYYCFVFISSKIFQIVTSERKLNSKVTVINKLTNNCNTILDTTK